MKFGIHGFLASLIANSLSYFQIQNVGFKMTAFEMKNRDNIGENMHLGRFPVSQAR